MKELRHHDVLPFSVDWDRSVRQQRFSIWASRVGAAALAFLLAAGLPFAAHAQTCANPAGGYEGFGRNTTGGAGKRIYRVNTVIDYLDGTTPIPGSLRWALSAPNPMPEPATGNRCIVFDVGGTIAVLPSEWPAPCGGIRGHILVKGPNVTIDGFSAPSPGITLINWGLDLHGKPLPEGRGVENAIVRGIRIRDTVPPECAGADGFQIVGVNNFVIDHVSVARWGDGSLDVAGDTDLGWANLIPSRNGTIQWSIIGKGNLGSYPDGQDTSLLIKYGTHRISLHHNLLINASDRSPYCAWSNNDPTVKPPLDEIVCDVRNNLIWGYGWAGTSVRHNGTANVVNNYYFSSDFNTADNALYVPPYELENGVPVPYFNEAYASGNFSPCGLNIDAKGNRTTPFPADPITTTDAVTAAQQILAEAGAQGANFGRDTTDLDYVNQIDLSPVCP